MFHYQPIGWNVAEKLASTGEKQIPFAALEDANGSKGPRFGNDNTSTAGNIGVPCRSRTLVVIPNHPSGQCVAGEPGEGNLLLQVSDLPWILIVGMVP